MPLSLVTPPVLEPLTVLEVQRQLRLDVGSTDLDQDTELIAFIAAARQRAELATQRAMCTQTYDLVLDACPDEPWIELPYPPLASVTSLKYLDQGGTLTTWPATNYVVDAPAGPRCRRGRISLAYGACWPLTYRQAGAVTVRFVCGHTTAAAVPSLLRIAMLMDIGSLYTQRERINVGNIVSELPGTTRDIYRAHKSYPSAGGMR